MKAKIAFLPGDGIGPEVLAQAKRVLDRVGEKFGHSFEIVEGLLGGVAIEKYDTPLPAPTIDLCKSAKAVLMGAVGDKRFDALPFSKKPERGLLELRKLLGNFANLRPIHVYDPLAGASTLRQEVVQGVDIMFVRELLGGIYFGSPRSRDANRAIDTEVYTADEVRRVTRVAFSLAKSRRKHLTSVDKANVLETSILWRNTVLEVSRDFPDVTLDHLYVDNAAMQFMLKPKSFDVVVTNNMFGDILTDEAAVLTGSLGMLPSASIGGSVGLYEPVHGSAPDIAGKSLANPIGAIASVAMMLEYSLQAPDAAARVQAAIAAVLEKGYRTRDLGGDVSTIQMGDAICGLI